PTATKGDIELVDHDSAILRQVRIRLDVHGVEAANLDALQALERGSFVNRRGAIRAARGAHKPRHQHRKNRAFHLSNPLAYAHQRKPLSPGKSIDLASIGMNR